MKKEPPFMRIAFRDEGEFVNAYIAPPDTMEGAVFVASVRRSALRKTDGAFEAYQALMRMVADQLLEDMGLKNEGWNVVPAPEHERTGNA